MMICKECGMELNGERFCFHCGAPAGNEIVVQRREISYSGGDIRRQSLADMNSMMNYFGMRSEEYNSADLLEDEITRRSQRGYYGWLTSGILMGLAAYLLIKVSGNLDEIGAYIVFGFPAAFALSMFALLRKRNAKKLRAAQERYTEITEELMEYYDAYGYCPLGFEYTHPVILAKIKDTIRKGRANTPETALNILLEDIHRDNMEANMAATAAATAETARYSRETAHYSKQAARNAGRAAGYAAASYWFK